MDEQSAPPAVTAIRVNVDGNELVTLSGDDEFTLESRIPLEANARPLYILHRNGKAFAVARAYKYTLFAKERVGVFDLDSADMIKHHFALAGGETVY